jgi:hypothetical protein
MRCVECGLALEEDGIGLAPPGIRAQLLRNGTWSVVLNNDLSMVTLARALARIVGMSATSTLRLLKSSKTPGCIGTESEMNWLAAELRREGVNPIVQQAVPACVDIISLVPNPV